MSIESQAEKIWQYAMRPCPVDGDANVASLNVGDGRLSDDTSTDIISDQFGSMPSRFSFHGLAQTQTQSQGVRFHQEASPGSPESQKENRHLHVSSSSSSPITGTASPTMVRSGAVSKAIGATNNCKPTSSSHVTSHVTGASARVAPFVVPKNAPATVPSNSVALMEKQGPALCASPMRQMTRAVTFLSPKSPPSPPALSHTNTMPQPNRYAPREIDRMSQDSFAGSPIPQDLNSYVRNSSVFNNTYIRRGRDGRPGEVFEHPSHVSNTTMSLSDPPPPAEVMSSSQSEQAVDEGPSTSQIVRAAFDPRLSPIPAPEPVILVKDSQSPHSQGSKGAGDHNGDDGDDISGDASGIGALSSNSSNVPASLVHSPPSYPHTPSSSSVSFQLPQEDVADAAQLDTQSTQPNTQSTQPNTQLSDTDPQTNLTIPPSAGHLTAGRSPLPVPPHRRRQVAALQAARLRAKEEVIPETPVSTAGQSVPTSVQGPSTNVPAVVNTPKILSPRSAARRLQMGKEGISHDSDTHLKPSSKGKGKANQTDQPVQTSPARMTRSAMAEPLHNPEVTPDPQDMQGQEQWTVLKRSPTRRHRPRESEVVPDSQDEQQQSDVHDRASSPAVPLIQMLSHRASGEILRPPTPTPAAVKSPLRKGLLPEGVTHTRGGGGIRAFRGSRKVTPVLASTEVQTTMSHQAVASVQGDESSDADEEQPEPQQARPQTTKRKAISLRPTRVKRELSSKKQKMEAKQTRGHQGITATTLAPGPSTRSRKRKSDTPAESPKDTEAPVMISAPPKKRPRSIPATTPAPTVPAQLNIRVLARRTDKRNYYFPGTVNVEAIPSDPVPVSTVFLVIFDDGHEEGVDVEYMRQFELELEDVVRVTERRKGKIRTCSAQVLDVERWDNAEIAEVHELDQGPDADDYEIEGRFLSVPEELIDDQWNERRVSIRTLLRDKDFDPPGRNECLSGIGFIITLPDLPRSKRSLVKLIEVSGGLVYDDWSAIVSLNGTVEVTGKRIVGRTADVRIGKESRKTTPLALFCLTDEPRTTPKYLIALALGVPCLSMDWVLDRVVQCDTESYVDWPAYILPAGYNPVTRMPASQAFNRAWWLKEDNLQNLLLQPPILKPFTGKSFLCVGAPEFLFSKKEFGTFPKVLLAMGASHVQAVTDVDRVNVKGPQGFDYTVVDDGDVLVQYKDAIAVNVSWLKKCLVTGVIGPFPWPDREVP